MSEYISKEQFVTRFRKLLCEDCDRRKGIKNGKLKFCYEIGDAPCRACEIDDMLDRVEDFEPADVAPVKHGEWIEDGYYNESFVCSNCGEPCRSFVLETHKPRWKYCPICGAKMEVDG